MKNYVLHTIEFTFKMISYDLVLYNQIRSYLVYELVPAARFQVKDQLNIMSDSWFERQPFGSYEW